MSAAAPGTGDFEQAGHGGGTHRIGIIAGGGSLPAAVAGEALKAGYDPFILALAGNAAPIVERFPHAYVHIGQVGRMLRILRRERCTRLVFLGGLSRPNLFRIRIDWGFARYLPQLLRLMKGGDDAVLRGVARFFEERGFKIAAAHEIAPNLLAPEGVFSRASPTAEDMDDIRLGFKVTRELGLFDIGQAAAVARNYVLAVEAAEGTDAMLRRCRGLNSFGHKGRQGVLVKRPKPGQDRRLDLPAIGPATVELAAEARLAGIAVEAGAVLLADVDALVEEANRHCIFLYGVTPAEILGD
jgi:UDP-2,3-diacylglucosamine hydrolase